MQKTVRASSNALPGLRNSERDCDSTNIKPVFAKKSSTTGLGSRKPSPLFSVTYGVRGLYTKLLNNSFPLTNVP